MLRSAMGKVAWVGRTASMVFGLALVLALVVGAASTAWSATGGNFILGKANAATTVSRLTASVAGPALTLVNQSTEAAATALNISVAEGKAPLKVNAAAGTATNLSADELDGKSSKRFADAAHPHSGGDITSGTVADARIDDAVARDGEVMPTVMANDGPGSGLDADKLDGEDSNAFLPSSTYELRDGYTSGTNIGNGSGIHHASLQCDEGDELLTGGHRWGVNATSLAVVGSWPDNNSWIVQWANTDNPAEPYDMQIYVKCADTAAPAHG